MTDVSSDVIREKALKIIRWGVEEARQHDAMYDEALRALGWPDQEVSETSALYVENNILAEIESILRTAEVNA